MCEVLQHAFAWHAPGEAARAAVNVHAVAVPYVQHQELGALADLCMLGIVVYSCACPGVAHEHEELGGFLSLQKAVNAGAKVLLGMSCLDAFTLCIGVYTLFTSLSIEDLLVTTVLEPLAIQCLYIGVVLDGIGLGEDVNTRNLRLVALLACLVAYCPPWILHDTILVLLVTQRANIIDYTRFSRIWYDLGETPAAPLRDVFIFDHACGLS